MVFSEYLKFCQSKIWRAMTESEQDTMAKRKDRNFGQVIRDRRRQLDLTQQEIARRIKTSTPYVGHLESSKRHPSDKVLGRLAQVLGLDRRELFLLANPQAGELLRPNETNNKRPAWEDFRKDEQIRRTHHITSDEMQLLSSLDLMGEISSPRDFIFVLNTVRHVLRRV
jgi:transcriptional regulator with XRE-family HTH domain